jgi:DNA polymerase-1
MTKTLLLVDGSSYLYRAFHAMPDLRTRAGEPTGAIYGVLNMLRRLHKDVDADYSAVVFDAKGKTFREDVYPEYKATRTAMPDELSQQIEPLHAAIRAMGWPLILVEGVEADDVIGTLAAEAQKRGIRTIISTGDKDMAQLVTPQVTLVNTMSNETLDEAAVEKKFGVRPERFVDYLTLVGDAIDNVPGVEKVGPKTAAKWVTQHQTLDNVIANAHQVTGVIGDNLRKVVDWLPKARELLTIKCDVPLQVLPEELAHEKHDLDKLAELFERFEFKSWRRELDELRHGSIIDRGGASSGSADASTAPERAPVRPQTPRDYETILTDGQLEAWLSVINAAPLVSVATVTTSLDPLTADIVGLALSVAPDRAAYIPVAHTYAGAPLQLERTAVLTRLKPWLENEAAVKVGHNLKFDLHALENHGVRMRGAAHDTLLESYVIESHKPHDMDNLAERHLGIKTLTFNEVCGKGAGQICFDQVEIERATLYAAEDADVTLQLHAALYPQIERDPKLTRVYSHIEMPVMPVLQAMERNGVLLDSVMLDKQSQELGLKMMELETLAHQMAGQPFNLNSPKQIQEILFDKQKLPVIKKTPSGTPSTDEDVLQQLALDYPLPKQILEYRGITKLKSTYTDKLPRMVNARTGRVHTTYGQAVAVTGRLASNDPNLQNIPVRTAEGRRIREAFIAPPGSHIVSADYSQVELRIMAHISQDAGLLSAFAAGEDIHRATAAEVFALERAAVDAEQRRYAKVINFGLIYGMSAFGLASQLGIERAAAQQYMDRYFTRYPGVAEYMRSTREKAREQGYVETIFGRRLWLPEIRGGNGARRQGAERAAINAPMQGTAADLIKLAMVAVQNWITSKKLIAKLIMQVHDELVLEVPDSELEHVKEELPQLMGGVAKLAVPLAVDVGVGANWDKAH